MKNIDELTKDYLPNSDIYLYQSRDMFRMNTDTHLLGNFLNLKSNETILDIGVNNGALLLYAKQYHPKFMIGVDIQEEACEIASLNMKYHQIENVEIHCVDIQNFDMNQVDVIVCNPPYFEVSDQQEISKRKIARNEYYLPMQGLFKTINRLLKEKGRCYIIHRANRLNELYSCLFENNLNLRQMTMIYDENHDYAHGVLLEIVKGKKVQLKVNAPLWIKR